jgi:hypothetical protein
MKDKFIALSFGFVALFFATQVAHAAHTIGEIGLATSRAQDAAAMQTSCAPYTTAFAKRTPHPWGAAHSVLVLLTKNRSPD